MSAFPTVGFTVNSGSSPGLMTIQQAAAIANSPALVKAKAQAARQAAQSAKQIQTSAVKEAVAQTKALSKNQKLFDQATTEINNFERQLVIDVNKSKAQANHGYSITDPRRQQAFLKRMTDFATHIQRKYGGIATYTPQDLATLSPILAAAQNPQLYTPVPSGTQSQQGLVTGIGTNTVTAPTEAVQPMAPGTNGGAGGAPFTTAPVVNVYSAGPGTTGSSVAPQVIQVPSGGAASSDSAPLSFFDVHNPVLWAAVGAIAGLLFLWKRK